jgi:amino acid transporter
LKSIPRAVILSLLISGAFFVFVCYVTVQGVAGYATPLDKIDAPLNVLAQLSHVPSFAAPLSLGAMISFFALALSCINASGRVIYGMGRHGLFPAALARPHSTNETPHVAVTILAVVAFAIATIAHIANVATLDLFNWAGTCAAFGFLVPYALITIAAPVYLKAIGQLRAGNVAVAACSLLLLAIPTVGSVYPVPDAPVNLFPYMFVAYLAVGLIWILAFYRKRPDAAAVVRDDLQSMHDRYVAANRPIAAAE